MKKHIPNIITCCNLISGCIAITFALKGALEMAFLWIVIGAVFDFFDGMTARLLHVSSPIGKELDSLADVVTFGVAPSTMVLHVLYMLNTCSSASFLCEYFPCIAYVMAAFSALRLAKFNLDERQALGFIGLPTPANALFWASLTISISNLPCYIPGTLAFVIVCLALSCWLLIAEIPMFALKFKQWGWKGNEIKYIFILSCIPILLIFKILGFAIIIAWYVLLSILTKGKNKPTDEVHTKKN